MCVCTRVRADNHTISLAHLLCNYLNVYFTGQAQKCEVIQQAGPPLCYFAPRTTIPRLLLKLGPSNPSEVIGYILTVWQPVQIFGSPPRSNFLLMNRVEQVKDEMISRRHKVRKGQVTMKLYKYSDSSNPNNKLL